MSKSLAELLDQPLPKPIHEAKSGVLTSKVYQHEHALTLVASNTSPAQTTCGDITHLKFQLIVPDRTNSHETRIHTFVSITPPEKDYSITVIDTKRLNPNSFSESTYTTRVMYLFYSDAKPSDPLSYTQSSSLVPGKIPVWSSEQKLPKKVEKDFKSATEIAQSIMEETNELRQNALCAMLGNHRSRVSHR